jgi:hypothetical protein
VDDKNLPSAWLGGGSGSWSDVAVADFIQALIEIRREDQERNKPVLPTISSKL